MRKQTSVLMPNNNAQVRHAHTQTLLVLAQTKVERKVINFLESSVVLKFLTHSLDCILHLLDSVASNSSIGKGAY